jgi:prephenate dehydratase
MRIAYQGEPGAYSEAAAIRFAPSADLLPCRSFEEVFAAVTEGRATHGILPMENSIGGSIHRNYDLLVEHELPIVGETELMVDHCLLALPGTKLDDVKVVYSHPQALAQCERALEAMAGVDIVAVYDTAGAAKMIRDGGRPDAAVFAPGAAEVFDRTLRNHPGLQRQHHAFFVVARRAGRGRCRQDVDRLFPHSTPGALFKALAGFALRDINLTKLESRPLRGRPWEYMFYADVEVAREALECGRALAHLGEFTRWVRTLGSYKSWKKET